MWLESKEHQGVWQAEYTVPGFEAKGIAVRLKNDKYLIYSAGCGLSESFRNDVGEVAYLLVPNRVHHMGVKEWGATFPDAKVLCTEGLIPLIEKKTSCSAESWTQAKSDLPSEVSIVELPEMKAGELMLTVQSQVSLTWYICDIFMNMQELPKHWLYGFVLKLCKAGPGLGISSLMLIAGIKDKKILREWFIKKLENDQPNRIVPQHGKALNGAADRERLERLIEKRLS